MASGELECIDLSIVLRRIKEYLRKIKNVDFDAEELLDLLMKKDKQDLQDVVLKAVGLALEFDISKENKDEDVFLLSVFKYVSENYLDDLDIPNEQSSLSSVRSDAFGFLKKLEDSLKCLSFLRGSDPDIITACSELPWSTGSELFGALEVEILQLLEPTETENEAEKDQRYAAIIDHIDLYCYLSILREFAFLYMVILCVINGNSENIGKGYFKVTKLHGSEMVSKLKLRCETETKRKQLNTQFQTKQSTYKPPNFRVLVLFDTPY